MAVLAARARGATVQLFRAVDVLPPIAKPISTGALEQLLGMASRNDFRYIVWRRKLFDKRRGLSVRFTDAYYLCLQDARGMYVMVCTFVQSKKVT